MITLSSDFGRPYPAAMKGVLLARTDAQLIDISHEFPRQDVRTAAFWLREILPWFPPAVHLVVVDPGVGTDRAALAVRAGRHALVGPDNGVLVPAARILADEGEVEAFEIAVEDPASHTFHGRDVFAPAAARIHEHGIEAMDELSDLVATDDYDRLSFPEPEVSDEGARGEVLVVDDFGNVITNMPGTVLENHWDGEIEVNGEVVPVARSYAHLEAGARLVTVGSHDNVELAVNRGRGDEAFGLHPGDVVRLGW